MKEKILTVKAERKAVEIRFSLFRRLLVVLFPKLPWTFSQYVKQQVGFGLVTFSLAKVNSAPLLGQGSKDFLIYVRK